MNALILNRDFKHPADGWYHLEPKGEHANAAAKVTQVIDDEACQTIVDRFNADATAGTLSHGHEMLIDHEHFKHDSDKETIAYGWLQKLQHRPDGMYGQVRWTATGQKAVDGGDYRFFSTEYDPADLKVLNPSARGVPAGAGALQKVRPLRLDGLTLTNDPNNRGARPITNRGDNHFAGAGASVANENKNNQVKPMHNIALKLGLAAEASEDAVLEAVTRLQNRVATLEPLSAENTTLKNRLNELDAEQVEALMDAHGIKPDETQRREKLKPVLVSLKNRTERVSFLKECLPTNAGANAAAQSAAQQMRLTNRDTRPPDTSAMAAGDSVPNKEQAQKIMNRATELRTQNKSLSMPTAITMAQRELTQS